MCLDVKWSSLGIYIQISDLKQPFYRENNQILLAPVHPITKPVAVVNLSFSTAIIGHTFKAGVDMQRYKKSSILFLFLPEIMINHKHDICIPVRFQFFFILKTTNLVPKLKVIR